MPPTKLTSRFNSTFSSESNFPKNWPRMTYYQNDVTHLGRRYKLSSKQLDFPLAEQACRDDDAILVVVKDKNLSDVIINMVNASSFNGEYPNLRKDGVWIGLELVDNKHGYWADGGVLNETRFENWAQPPDTRNGHCVQLWGAYLWKWDDTYCDLSKFFICEDKDPTSYTSEDVGMLATSILQLSTTQANTSILNLVASKLNNLLEINEDIEDETFSSKDVLLAVDRVARNYNLTTEGTFTANFTNVEVTITNEKNATDGLTLGEDITTESSSSVLLSNQLKEEAINKMDSEFQISSLVYRKTGLFEPQNPDYSALNSIPQNRKFGDGPIGQLYPTIMTHVISADIRNTVMQDLKHPVFIYHNIPNHQNFTPKIIEPDVKSKTAELCVFWDFNANNGDGDWSQNGCSMINSSSIIGSSNKTHLVTCSCNHMTHFAVILSTTLTYEPQYLTLLTIIGCSISIICLLATLGTNLYFRQLRTKLPQQVLMHLSGSIILLNLLFLIGIDLNKNDTSCFVVALFLHYAVLLVWCWMLVEAVFLFRTLVITRVESSSGKCFIWSAALISYSAPAIVVAASASSLPKESYQSMKYCWLASDPLLYSIVYPIAVMLSLNLLIFFIVMYNITYRSQMFRKNVNLRKISQAVKRALCMLVVLGLAWVLGYVMLLSQDKATKDIFTILFTILNSLQGFFVFILYCFRQENVRNLWLRPLTRRYQVNVKRIRFRNRAQNFTNDQTQDATATVDNVSPTRKTSEDILSSRPGNNMVDTKPKPAQRSHINTPPPPLPVKTSVDNEKPFRSGWA
uniref:adhesion G-protein coupled receptor G6-like isoform X2 n=1 Tax=Ciona intestinalis TaxID=7719 RepID=UPI000EF4AD27|nr:adhesion G-protein coupled receptor G6-like isoform X2 [Ciona intestinalis]|eukprot:XP_026695108.1 adhesion G-protein coupled receptor G6-like isoform X2 [Ciona intestinalis]